MSGLGITVFINRPLCFHRGRRLNLGGGRKGCMGFLQAFKCGQLSTGAGLDASTTRRVYPQCAVICSGQPIQEKERVSDTIIHNCIYIVKSRPKSNPPPKKVEIPLSWIVHLARHSLVEKLLVGREAFAAFFTSHIHHLLTIPLIIFL